MPHPKTGEPFADCPNYTVRTHAGANEVWGYLEDYKRGALGSVWDLPNALYESLRWLECEISEREAWLHEQREAVNKRGR